VSPVKYELGFYIPEDGILHNHRREHLKSYNDLVDQIIIIIIGISRKYGPSQGRCGRGGWGSGAPCPWVEPFGFP
jgi:hypothetical protein